MQVARALAAAPSPERLAMTIEEHRAILAALTAGDPDEARDAMRRHIEASRERVFVGPGIGAR